MEIRKAEIQDLDRIIELNQIINYENPDDFMLNSISEGQVFVSIEDQKITGYLLYQLIWWNTPFIALIKIFPDFQKKWYGKALIDICEQEFKSKGLRYYYSSTGSENGWAQIFHEKLWFSGIWDLKMNFWDEIFYRKDL